LIRERNSYSGRWSSGLHMHAIPTKYVCVCVWYQRKNPWLTHVSKLLSFQIDLCLALVHFLSSLLSFAPAQAHEARLSVSAILWHSLLYALPHRQYISVQSPTHFSTNSCVNLYLPYMVAKTYGMPYLAKNFHKIAIHCRTLERKRREVWYWWAWHWS